MSWLRRTFFLVCACLVALPVAAQPRVRVVGRVNVNAASREELLRVPGLDPAVVDRLVRLRALREIDDLSVVGPLSSEVAIHLKTEGESTLVRILQNPLVRLR